MGNESAIIMPIAEVEPIVGKLRLEYDKAARLGVPAHVTLLYPFRPPQAAIGEIEALREFFNSTEPFQFFFTEVRHFPATAYLHPDNSERFIRIIHALLKRWPDCRPYNGAFPDIVPHLTVAHNVGKEILDAVDNSVRQNVPIRCVAREAWLLVSDSTGFWSKQASFLLSAAALRNDTGAT
ncbi:MAG TPA: 2'-5' RNA ligase family protein [Candidatus Angelobacter sp.]|jgi:2'-5' RNA ligase|nr:2'-5' RNA ligase family protein [Candidatus Angelobacter sp.]